MTQVFAIFAHLVGDYIIQSSWMAREKTKNFGVALIHAATYTLPFLLLTLSWKALLVICLTHAVIDHFQLARYVIYARNYLFASPSEPRLKWKECSGTGSSPDTPPFLSVWLMIIADNTFHLIINAAALEYL